MKPIVSQPVEVTNPEPLPVEVVGAPDTAAESKARAVSATARVDADILSTEGQRRINLIWESTQAVIAVTVTLGTLVVVAALILRGDDSATAFLLLSNAFFMIVTSYFQRTNHTRVGGIGPKTGESR